MIADLWLVPLGIAFVGAVALVLAAQAMGAETRMLRAEFNRVSDVAAEARALRAELKRGLRA